MLNNDQRNYVVKLLSHALAGNFAFYVRNSPGQDEPDTVFYAQDHGSWSCIINLVQGIAAAGCDPQGAVIYISGNTPYNGAAEGMCSYFNMDVWRAPLYNGPFSAGMIQFSHRYMEETPFATFSRIEPNNILYRDSLDTFLNLNLGPNPFAQLQGVHQTHLHRVYMALAFRRVQCKLARGEQGLAIAALLVNSGDGRIRALTHNTKNHNVTYHAEVNLVQAFIKNNSGEKDGHFVIYSTLQPCPMCAAIIAEKLPNAMVFYGHNDSGNHMDRMKSKPQVCMPLHNLQVNEQIGNGMQRVHSVKNLHGYGQHRALGPNIFLDVVDYMDSHQEAWRQKKEYSLTRNLYKDDMKLGIKGASETINRKVQQYHDNQKSTFVPHNQFKSQRRQAVKNVVEHIYPLLASL